MTRLLILQLPSRKEDCTHTHTVCDEIVEASAHGLEEGRRDGHGAPGVGAAALERLQDLRPRGRLLGRGRAHFVHAIGELKPEFAEQR